MFKKTIIVFSMLVLCITAASAQEKKESALSSWFKELQKKIDLVTPKKNLPMSTGVAGVRGAKEDSKAKLYWKGKKGDEQVSEDELKEFKEWIAFAEKGDNAAAVRELEEFMKQYPDSALIPDARKSLDLLKAEAKPQETAAPAQQK